MASPAASTDTSLLELRSVSRSYPGVQALSDVSLRLESGRVLGLMGENGAGKSTLIRILGGALQPDSGEIRIDGQTVGLTSPTQSMQSGIGVIYQELTLVPALNACDNLFLGRRENRFWIHHRGERTHAERLLGRLGVQIPLDVPVRELSIAHQQIIEIARVLDQNVRILVMDEPTAALSPQEVQQLFRVMEELKARGIGIIYVSHRLDEIFRIADDVTILRDGRHVADFQIGELSRAKLIELMVGRSLSREFHRTATIATDPILEVRGLSRGSQVRNISFTIHRGEIFGLTGLAGSGRTETARLIFGADTADSGEILLHGRKLILRNPEDAIREGICLLTEDRKGQGLIPARNVRENFSLPSLTDFQHWGFLRWRHERTQFGAFVERLRIRISGQEQLARNLSGGNQQKVLLARWLQRQAQVFLFDEPTRGVDIGARQEIYELISDLAAAGNAVLVISSELPEILSLCDRIAVLRQGELTGILDKTPETTQAQIMDLAVH